MVKSIKASGSSLFGSKKTIKIGNGTISRDAKQAKDKLRY